MTGILLTATTLAGRKAIEQHLHDLELEPLASRERFKKDWNQEYRDGVLRIELSLGQRILWRTLRSAVPVEMKRKTEELRAVALRTMKENGAVKNVDYTIEVLS
jgi:hypothetical protein